MSKAFEMGIQCLTMYNVGTTSIKAFKPVKLAATQTVDFSINLISTKGTVPAVGVAQETISPSTYGKVAFSGISRVMMGGTTRTTLYVTTPAQVAVNASSCGKVLTTTTYWSIGTLLHVTSAASQLVAVHLSLPAGTAR